MIQPEELKKDEPLLWSTGTGRAVWSFILRHQGERAGDGAPYAYIRDADALHAELTARGADVQGKPVSRPWGLRDFSVLDLDGNRLTFGTFE